MHVLPSQVPYANTSSERSNQNAQPAGLTFKGVLIHNEQTVNLHLFTEGGLVGRSAAGKELAGTHAAGESLEGPGFMGPERRRGRNEPNGT